MSFPTVSEPAGTLRTALPRLNVIAPELNVPLDRATEPVGVGLPLTPFTVTVAVRDCAVEMLD